MGNLSSTSSIFTFIACTTLACGPADFGESGAEQLSRIEESLWLKGSKWPDGNVPVCFAASATTATPEIVRQIRDTVNRTWATVANIDFTGWGACPTNANGRLRITLVETGSTGTSWSQLGYLSGSPTNMTLNVQEWRFPGALVTHEFGHALGFAHEFERPDFRGTADCAARDTGTGGDTLDTPPDPLSQLASTYCGNRDEVSAWDAVGAINAYGPRVDIVRPIVTGWSSGRTDHASVVTAASISTVKSQSYRWAYADGWVFTSQLPGTRPLKIYYNTARQDFATATNTTTINALVAAGYVHFRDEGYVFSGSQSGTVPLKQYWSSARQDHMVVTPGASEDAAVGAGYSFLRIEGYIPRETPYSLLWLYRSTSRTEFATTKQASMLSEDLHDAGYDFVRFDGAAWRHNFPDTVALRNYWSSARLDHFLLANSVSEGAAIAAGYRNTTTENTPASASGAWPLGGGYVHSSTSGPFAGTTGLGSYWKSSDQDHITTTKLGSLVTSLGYSFLRTEGLAISTH